MVYILHSSFLNTMVACLTTVAFTTVTCAGIEKLDRWLSYRKSAKII